MNLRWRLDSCALGLCVLVGLVGAFVGLGVSSLWVDELFTAWVVGADGNAAKALDRALQDVHPPFYYLSLFAYSLPFGASDVALRSFSAIAAVSAIGVFVFGCASTFSLNGRLFGAAIATGSSYWFIQAQNARSYALALLLGAGILALSLSLLRRKEAPPQHPATSASLFALILLGAFTHFYLGVLGLAVLLVLAVMRPDYRVALVGSALVVAATMLVYLRFVVKPLSQWLKPASWIRDDLPWYLYQISSALGSTLDRFGVVAIAVCAAFIALSRGRESALTRTRTYIDAVRRQPRRVVDAADSTILFLVGVPAVVLSGAVVSSALLSPNFSARNFLIVSPFLWGLAAKAYDEAFERAPSRIAPYGRSVAITLVAAMTFVVQARAFPRNMPFRDAGDWIASFAACRGETIPILLDDAQDAQAITKAGFLEMIIPATRARYLPGMKPVLVRAIEEPPTELVQVWGERQAHGACPILAWSVDPATPARADEIAAIFGKLLGSGVAERVRVRFFPEPEFRRYGQQRLRNEGLFVVYVETQAAPRN